VQEIRTGCDSVSFDLVSIGSEPQICTEEGKIKFTLENGPRIALDDLKASVIGEQGVLNLESTLNVPVQRSSVVALEITANVGDVRQLRLTPKIKLQEDVIFCADQVSTFENLRKC